MTLLSVFLQSTTEPWVNIEFSNVAIYRFLFFSIILFLAFRFLSGYLRFLFRKKKVNRWIQMILPAVELLVWIVFFVWAIEFFMRKNQILALGMFVILLFMAFWVSRFSLRDIIAGVVFKAGSGIHLNENVQIGEYFGKVVKLKLHSLVLETEKGKTVFIPYNTAVDKIRLKPAAAETITSHSFEMHVPKGDDIIITMEKIRTAILQLPWSSVKREPGISLISETKSYYTLEITVYSLSKEYFYRIEEVIKKRFGE